MHVQVYFVKIVIRVLLTVNLVVSVYQPPLPDIDIKDSNGNDIQIHNKLNCYALYVKDVGCTDSGQYVAPLTYLYGIKPMVFQNNHNCSKSNPSVLPKECCEPESNDCIFGSTKDIIQVWKNCGYKSHCPSLTGGRTSIKEGEDHTCTKEFITENDISTSQYSYLMYACLPEKMEVNFDGGNSKGKALLLKATETSFNTGIKLQCHINTDNNGVLVQFVDIRLCYENHGVCDQTLTFYKNGKAAKPLNTGSKFGLEPWQSSPGQANVTITFERQTPTTKFYILLYITSFKKGTSDMEIKCDQPIPITTTTTTTTTAAPTTATAAPTITGQSTETGQSIESLSPHSEERTTRLPGVTQKSEDQTLKEQLIKYGEIAGAGVAGIILASFVCHCRYKHRRNKRKVEHNMKSRAVEMSKYPRLGPVGAISQPSVVTDNIESGDSVSQVAERKRRRRKKKTSVASYEIVEEEGASSRAALIQILLKKLDDQPDFAVEILRHCGQNGEEATYKVGSQEFKEQLKTVLDSLATETLRGSLHELGPSGEGDNTLL